MANVAIKVKKELLDDLAEEMAEFDRRQSERTGRRELLVEWTVPPMPKKLKGEIRSKEHPPPHFHVECDGASASFSLLDGKRLPGVAGLDRYDSVIRQWWEENRRELCEIWNKSRPTDCKVGPIPLPP